MKRKISALIVTLLMCLTAIVIVPDDLNVKATSVLDYDLIYDVTYNLSEVIRVAYNETDLRKGRYFGSEGEHYAAKDIIAEKMEQIGLWSPEELDDPYLEPIENIKLKDLPYFIGKLLGFMGINSNYLSADVEILEKGLKFNDTTDNNNLTDIDCYIKYRDNGSFMNASYDHSLLTYNFSYTGVKVIRPNGLYITDFTEFIDYAHEEFLNYWREHPLLGLLVLAIFKDYITSEFEEYYDFNFDDIDPADNSTFPSFVDPDLSESCGSCYCVLLEENQGFNPKYYNISTANESFDSTWWEFIKDALKLLGIDIMKIIDWFKEPFWKKDLIREAIEKITDELENNASKACYENIIGRIKYDYTNESHDCIIGPNPWYVIFINGSDGRTLNESIDDYRIDFYINQKWNPSVESYNVIGQINGSDPSKTVIVSSLYDSVWSQGTADSAIGMAMVLAIAKYMKELEENYGIKPKYNVKFIGFCGEESGSRGAAYYSLTHLPPIYYPNYPTENIITMIDFNQIGFRQKDESWPELIMHVAASNIIHKQKLEKITGITDYGGRAPDKTYFHLGWQPFGGLSNTGRFAWRTNTVLFLKDKGWVLHHRDGQNHTEGDVMTYFDSDDVNLTAELAWNITKYFTLGPDVWFNNTNFDYWDYDNDGYSDTVNASFSFKTCMPSDHAVAKGVLCHMNFQNNNWFSKESKEYVIHRDEELSDYFNFTLNRTGPCGIFKTTVHLFNSTGEADNYYSNEKYWDQPFFYHLYANETVTDYESYLNPDDSPPYVAIQPSISVQNIAAGTAYSYTTSTTDPEGDQIYYQWLFNDYPAEGSTTYTGWMGPYDSGENCTLTYTWTSTGDPQVMVRARDQYLSPNMMSNWSQPLNQSVERGCSFTGPSKVLVNRSYPWFGSAYGFTPLNWSWKFMQGEGPQNLTQNATHNYSSIQVENVNFSAQYNDSTWCYFDKDVEVVSLISDFNIDDQYVKPDQTITFTNRSLSEHGIVNISWDFGDGNVSYDSNPCHNYSISGVYNVTLTVKDTDNNTDFLMKSVYVDSVPPSIISTVLCQDYVSVDKVFESEPIGPIGYGQNITFYTDFLDDLSDVDAAKVFIMYEDGSYGNYSMNVSDGSTYDYEFVYTNTSKTGQYYYYIWTVDKSNNSDMSSWYTFYISDVFGSSSPGVGNENISGNIHGSVFTISEDGIADSVNAYVQANESTPPKMKCMIYNTNDELLGTTEEKNISTGDDPDWITFDFNGSKPELKKNISYVLSCWSNNDCYLCYDNVSNATIGRNASYTYGTPPNPIVWGDSGDQGYSIYCSYSTLPEITNVFDSPESVGFGFNVNISADVCDTTLVDSVSVNITYPDNFSWNFTMINMENNTYEYTFWDAWKAGQYNYTIWAFDQFGDGNSSGGHSFNVSAQADMSVCTVKDAYVGNETVNLTDPPGPPLQSIGYELLDGDQVLRIWNKFDSYYFNTSNGVQFTNHMDEYWSHNVLMLGYYDNDVWNLIYRTDELSGFNKNISSDDETYVNATLWKDLTFGGYDFRLAVRYHLGVDDNELTVIPFIKNIDDEDIPYVLGFAWEIKDIQVDMTPSGDYIEIDGTWYYLNGTIDETYTNLSQPCYYIRENITGNTFESLYLRWNNSLDYKVKVESRDGEYNAPVTLGIKIGILGVGQEKYTSLFWHDASEVIYYFNGFQVGETWTYNPSYMINGNENLYASTSTDGDVELCNSNTCDGADLGTISKVELRCKGYYGGLISSSGDIWLRPVMKGDGNNHVFDCPTSAAWSEWFDITNDPNMPPWDFQDIDNLDCDVEADIVGFANVFCSKVEVRVTYNQLPAISNPFPADGSTGVPLTPMLNITVVDDDGDIMDITWLSNSSGSWVEFGSNSSVGNGTYHQTFVNASVNGQWWYWKVNVSDGTNITESSVYKFYTGNQSKIENNGSTDIKGYLLMQVQFFNGSAWIVADDTVNETTVRVINSSEQLALDTIFNGLVNTSDLLSSFGSGSYRVYACFRDPDDDVLVCDNQSLMEATYEFTVTGS